MSDTRDPADLQRDWARECFAVQRAIRYHLRRQGFYDDWNSLTNASAILLGAGTVAALAQKLPFPGVLSVLFPVLIMVFSTLNLVWGTTRRARLHNNLYRRYVEVERRILAVTDASEQALRAVRGERAAIEADEPPTMFVISVLCHNEVVRATGGGEMYRVPLLHRWLGHFWAFPDAAFPLARRNTA